jgi:hypothetical protein
MIHSKFHSYFWKKIKVFLPTKLSVLLKIIFFISLKSTKITSKIQISEVCYFRSRWSCDIQFQNYAVHINGDL